MPNLRSKSLRMSFRSRWFRIASIMSVALLAARLLYVYSNRFEYGDHVDDRYWLQSTYYYDLYFNKRDFSHPNWSNWVAYDHPQFGKYLLGMGLEIQGLKVPDTVGGLSRWHQKIVQEFWINYFLDRLWKRPGEEKSIRLKNAAEDLLSKIPSGPAFKMGEAHRQAGVNTVFFFACVSTLLFLYLCWKITGNLIASSLASLLFISNPNTIPTFSQVLSDSLCTAFALGSLLLCLHLLQRIEKLRFNAETLGLAAFLGMLCAMAGSIKYIAFYTGLGSATCMLVAAIYGAKKKSTLFQWGYHLVLFAVAGLATFVLLDPYFWTDTWNHISTAFAHRSKIMDIQYVAHSRGIQSLGERIYVLFGYGFLLGYPSERLGFQILALGILALQINGFFALYSAIKREHKSKLVGKYSVIAIWALGVYLLNGLKMHSYWNRYLIPFNIFALFLFSIGLSQLLQDFQKLRLRKE